MARRAVGAVARAHRRWRRLPAPPAPRTCRAAVGLALALVLAVSFALPAHALDRVIANWWEDEKYIDPTSSDYRPMKSHDWAQAFKTGWCEGPEGTGFELKFVSIKFQEPSTDGATEDRLELTLHQSGTIPGPKLATLRQQGSRIGTGSSSSMIYVPTTPVTLLDQQWYYLKLVDPAVDGDNASVSTAAVSLTASDREARTKSNLAVWTGQYKWQILDHSLYRTRGGDETSSEGWERSEDAIRLYVGADADASCGHADEDPPEPINTSVVVRAVPEDWPLVPTKLRVGDRFRLLFVTKGSRDATSSDIATYNGFVQSQCTAGGVEAIQDYCSDFRVLGGTSSVSARDNTYTNWRARGTNWRGTERRGLPVYWMNSDALSADLIDATLGGPAFYNLPKQIQTPARAASNYQFLYLWWLNRDNGVRSDGTKGDVSNLTVWTGSNYDGDLSPQPLGATRAWTGSPGYEFGFGYQSPLQYQYSTGLRTTSNSYPFYGISPVFKIVPATANAEVLPELTVANVAKFESGDGTAVDFTFDVILSFESDNEVTVYYETEDDTAEAGSDYTAVPRTELTFAPGETRKQVTVKVLDDSIEDSGEIFYLKFSDPSGATLDPNLDQGRATGMIFNAEAVLPEVSIAAGSAYTQEGAEAVFTLSRSGDAAEALTVPVTVAEDGSVLGTPVPESVTFAAGLTEAEFQVPTENDSLDEPDGTVTVTLAEAFEWQLAEGASSASVTVLDDDSPPVSPGAGVVLWSADMEVMQYAGDNVGAASADLFSNVGGTAGLTAKHLWYDAFGRSIRLAFTGPVADTGVSTLYVGEVAYPFPEGSSGEGGFTFDDVDVDWTAGETLSARIVKPSNDAASSDATLSALAVEDATLAPGFDAGVAVYRASVDSEKASVTVTAKGNDSDATVVIGPEADADPDRDGRQVAVPIRETVLTVTVTAADEKTQREYRVVLAPANPPVTVSFGASSYIAVEGGVSAAVTVRLSRDPGEAVTVPLTATSAGGAAAGDFEAPSEVTFESGGALTRTATVTAVDDESAEDGESVVLGFGTLPAGMAADGVTSTAVALLDTAPNSAPTGRPDIVGDALVGEGLFAVVDRIDDANGLVDAVFTWQWLRSYGGSDTEIADATGPAYIPVEGDVGRGIKVRVTYTDDDGYEESVTSEATAAVARPLTAHVADVPESHDGKTAFTFGLRFSESSTVDVTAEAIRDSVLEVSRGVVRKVVPGVVNDPDSGSNYLGWRITIKPNSQETIEVVLPAGLDCTLAGAVCTTDGKRLHESVQFRVPGPATVNLPPTGLPVIEGTAEVGETLTASADGLTGASFAWQWLSNDGNTDTEIEGATGSTYTLAVADEGKTVKVRVTFTDDGETEETLTSEATAAVLLPLTASFEDVPESHDGSTAFTVELRFSEEVDLSYRTLKGTGMEVTGCEVTSASRLERGSNMGWEIVVEPKTQATVVVALPADRACGTAGAICTDSGQHGKRLSGRVEFRVAGPATVNSAPTGLPAIDGTARVGETLTASADGIADADGLTGAVFSWQWLAVDASAGDGSSETAIEGATEASYTLTEADSGKAVKVRVTFTDGLGTEESVTSEATESVAALVPGAPRGLAVASLEDEEPVLALVWTAPESDGGSAVTGYRVQWKSGSEEYDGTESSTRQVVVTDLDNLTYRIAGLTAGVQYTVRVMASNAAGDGAPAEATATMADTLAPTLETAAVDASTLTLTWSEALDGKSVPATGAFTVEVEGTARDVDAVSVAERAVTLTLASAVAPGEAVTVGYAVPEDDSAARIQDAAGSDAAGFSEVAATNETEGSVNTAPTGLPAISGTPQVGVELTASASAIEDGDGLENATFVWQWLSNDGTEGAEDTEIEGATAASYTPKPGDVGKTLKVRVTFTDDGDTEETLVSAATDAIAARPNAAPAGSPAITGTEQVGETLTADTSAITDADGLENATYAYQWIANDGTADADIADATQSTYEVAAADEGKTLKVRVTFTDDGGTEETLVSEATEAIAARANAAPAGSPAITGTETVGETLTADTSAITDADGLENATYAYQWIANNGSADAAIADATQSTYEVAAADEGKTLKVRVTFTDDGDTEETLVSAATDAVAPESEPLTASFEGVPSEHDGENIFTFRLRFSEAPAVSYTVLRDESFAVTGGTVKKARRVNGRNDLREIHVEPTGYGDVTLTLAGGRACGTTGAICTADERELSNTLTATIRGPATLSVADARTQEGLDATVDFTVTLSRPVSGTVSVDYTTQDGSATAGADYTTASGILTFSSNQTSKTVSVTVLDDVHDDDGETFTLRLSNASGAAIVDGTATGTIENADPMPAAWLVRFGRTSATQVVGLLNARFDEVATLSSQLTLGGRSWRLSALRGGADRVSGGADVPATIPSGQADFSFPAASTGLAGAGAHSLGDGAAWSDAAPAPSAAPNPNGVVTAGGEATLLERTVWGLLTESAWQVDKRRFISRSSFDLSLSALGNDPDESIETVAATPDVPGHWSLWGRGALTHFGGIDDGVSLDGDVLTGLLGVDYARERWLAGVALAYHDGDGSYRSARRGDAGELDSTLVSVNPYLRYALTERLSVWGALGYGQGTLRLRPERDAGVPQESIETDMQMGMGALGLRGTVYASEHTELAVKSDVLWVRTSSADAPGMRAVDNADTSRVRLLLSGRHQRALANDALLTPSFELGLRYDDGDAERGFGMELGGGLRYADPVRGLTLETRARALLAHEDGGYEEWGVGGSLALDPGRLGRGLALRLDSGWGMTDSGTEALWQRQSTAGLARQHDAPAQGRITAEMGYGLDVPYSYGLLTPYGSVELAGGGSRTLRLGWRFELGQRLSLSLAGERRETAHARPEHGLMLRTTLPW